MSERETGTPPAAVPPAAPANLSPACLGLDGEALDALASRLWCPVPESLKKSLREIWALPPELARTELARRRERALLALPLLAVGLLAPGVEIDGALDFALDFAQAASDVRALATKSPPQKRKTRKLRTLVRMRDAAARAGRLCGDDDDDGARWRPVVRRLGLRKFVAVLDKAERMQDAGAKDSDGKPVRDWGAYLAAMLDKAGKAETEGGKE